MKRFESASRRDVLALGLGAAAMAGVGTARAADAPYDLVIKGGLVIDPAQSMNAVGDVAIAGGRIVAVAPSIAAGKSYTFDATNKVVAPGLIDIHTHSTQTPSGPRFELQDGVTGWIDGGTRGADTIETAIGVVRTAPQTAALLVSIGRHGLGAYNGNVALADVAACRAAIETHRDVVVGVKVRMSKSVTGDLDLEILRRAQEVTTPLGLPVMIHIGDSHSPLGAILNLMKRGDIVTHILAPPPNNIFGANGRIIPEVAAARARGVKFDVGHGLEAHWGFALAEQALQQGLVPDTLSTDWTKLGHDTGRIAMPEMMTNLLSTGLPLERVIAMVTINAANCFPLFSGRGTLRPGAPADVTILELRQGAFELRDSIVPPTTRAYTQKLFTTATMIGGKLLHQA